MERRRTSALQKASETAFYLAPYPGPVEGLGRIRVNPVEKRDIIGRALSVRTNASRPFDDASKFVGEDAAFARDEQKGDLSAPIA